MADAFGDENVFFDVESIGFGMDFREVIRHTLGTVDVVLALVGPGFSPQRLAQPHDVVRLELTTAFDLQVPVIPVLIEAAEMPGPETLPEDLQGFAYLHAARLRADPDFRPDAARLIDAVRRIATDRRPDPSPPPAERAATPAITDGWAPIALAPRRPGPPVPSADRRHRALVDQIGPSIAALAFSPDGTLLAGAGDRIVHLWEPAGGGHLRTFGTDGTPSDLAFLPRDRLLAVATSNGLRHFDPATGRPPRGLPPHPVQLHAIAFSPDGRFLAGSDGDTLNVWHSSADGVDDGLQWAASGVAELAFSPDGRLLAGADAAARLWDPATGNQLRSLDGHRRRLNSVAFSPDGRWLAGADDDGTIHLWDLADRRLVRTITSGRQPVRRVAFSPDGRVLASAATSGTVRLWDPTTGERLAELTGHSVAIRDVAFSPDGALLATSGGARHGVSRSEVFLWDLGARGGTGGPA
jgi:sugar lactone lactonase YvrE